MTAPFPETSYGVVKRLEVVGEWIHRVSARVGKSSLTILDYGCGTGDQLTAPLARLGHCVLGLDMHAPSVATAQERHQLANLTFRTDDIATLVAGGSRFDVVICSEVLEHVIDPAAFLAQLRKLITPHGALIITTPNGYGSFELLRSAERALRRIGVHQALRSAIWTIRGVRSRLGGAPPPSRPLEGLSRREDVGFLNFESGHVQFFRAGGLEALFRDAGFGVAARRARTLLCGPYLDALFAFAPGRQVLLRWNNLAADILPFRLAADWMFLLQPDR